MGGGGGGGLNGEVGRLALSVKQLVQDIEVPMESEL